MDLSIIGASACLLQLEYNFLNKFESNMEKFKVDQGRSPRNFPYV